MHRRIALVALSLSTVALIASAEDIRIEPSAPGAHGLVTLDMDVDPAEWSTLEIRMAATADLASDDPSEGEGYGDYEDLAETEFPYEYWVGGGYGTSPHSEFRILAWLSDEDAEADRDVWDDVPDGSPWAEEIVDLGDCSNGCGDGEVDLMLAW